MLAALTLGLVVGGCTEFGAWDARNREIGGERNDATLTVGTTGDADYATIEDALAAAAPGEIIVVAAGSYGSEGAAGDPIQIDVAGVTLRGAHAGVPGFDLVRAGNGVVDESGTRAGASYVVSNSAETEINDPIRVTAPGVTIDGFTFDVTGIFGFSADVELSGGNSAVTFASGTSILNSRFIETTGGDTGAANQVDLATTVASVTGLRVSGNAFFGEAPNVQIGPSDFTGAIEITRNVIVDGSLNVTVGPGSTADITVRGNSISGLTPTGDFPFGLIGTGFAADSVPAVVLSQLNDVAAENDFFDGVITLAGSDEADDLSRFASSLRDFFYADGGDDTLAGLGGDDELGGGGGSDTLIGGEGDDVLLGDGYFASQSGVDGDDVLVGGPGDDTLIGGPGTDTAVFSAEMSEYSMVTDDAGTPLDPSDDITTVTHLSGPDGTDTLTEIELFDWDSE